ncbi:thiolase-like protein [Colletotrichum zoysiae]|uniref:Thiolase-like protein n=1 Tax=Colletotrichum zoysiae TaxID=1216348 RepID=A0AAD9M987_9PEZI|nr:thiolase-like protein [Colletotrichum zoysiae]
MAITSGGKDRTSCSLPAVPAPEPIAIVSIACRLPGHATSPNKLWECLQAGGMAVSDKVPASRYNSAGHDEDPERHVHRGHGPCRVRHAVFFSFNKADEISTGPHQRQLLEVVYECPESGGITLEKISGQEVGCFVGGYSAGYHDIQNRNPEQRPPGMTVGIGRAILSNRISHFLNIRGARLGVLVRFGWRGRGLPVPPDREDECRHRGRSQPLDVARTSPGNRDAAGRLLAHGAVPHIRREGGRLRAEAVNAVFLKRLSDAVRNADPIRAAIRGTANNSDGRTPGINSPSSEAQAAVIRAAYADAGLGLDSQQRYTETGYLECHGTGTPAGDPLEVKGAASALCQGRLPPEPLIIGSLNSNIGHSEPGAGISGLIKATMAVESGTIPGNPTFVTPSPNFDFDGLRVRPTRWNMPWPKTSNKYRRASVNSFCYGGSNAHAVLENAEHFFPAPSGSVSS